MAASAILAFLMAAFCLFGFVRAYEIVQACKHETDCDQVPILSPVPIIVALTMAAAAALSIWRRIDWPLVLVWLSTLLLPLAMMAYFFIPSVRVSYGLPPLPSVPHALMQAIAQPIFLFCMLGFALALLAWLPVPEKSREGSAVNN